MYYFMVQMYYFFQKRYNLLLKEQINQHITLIKRDSIDTLEPLYCKEDIDALLLSINFKKKSKHKSLICEYCGENKSNHTSMDIVNHYEGIFNIDSQKEKQFLLISINKDYLYDLLPHNNLSEDIFEFFQSKKSGRTLSDKKTNFRTQTLAKEIFNSPYNSALDQLYIESKALELIHTELNNLFFEKQKDPNMIKFSNQDKEAIYHAREILRKNLANIPSIKELARMVAINELKLKVGFRTFFNQTPYNVSLEYRLQEAKKLLSASEMNMNEIAEHIGYKYAGSFTKAFYKRFGVRPKNIMKSRKYYY